MDSIHQTGSELYPPGEVLLSPDGQLRPSAARADLEHKVRQLCELLAEALEARCPGCGDTRAQAVRR